MLGLRNTLMCLSMGALLLGSASCDKEDSESPTRPTAVVATSTVATTTTTVAASTTVPGTTTSVPATTTSVASTTTTTVSSGTGLAYAQDVKPILDADCLRCHSASNASAGISFSTYADVMRIVVPGSGTSTLVASTQTSPRGTMNKYLTGDTATKAATIRNWVVDYKAVQTR